MRRAREGIERLLLRGRAHKLRRCQMLVRYCCNTQPTTASNVYLSDVSNRQESGSDDAPDLMLRGYRSGLTSAEIVMSEDDRVVI